MENNETMLNEALALLFKKRSNYPMDGKKTYYHCNTHKNCDYQIMIFWPAVNSLKLVFESGIHGSELKDNRKGVESTTKAHIKEMFLMGFTKPSQIKKELRRKGIEEPSDSQIKNYLVTLRKELYGPNISYLNDLEMWANQHSVIPEDRNEPFVLKTMFNYSDASFSIAISTSNLMNLSTKADFLHADATYKLVWNGFPLLVIGNSDKERVILMQVVIF